MSGGRKRKIHPKHYFAAEILGNYRSARILASGTVEQYSIAARNWDSLSKIPLTSADADTVARFATSLLAAGLSPAAARRRVAAIRTIHRWAVSSGWARTIEDWPTVRAPRREPVALTLDQFHRLITACRDWSRSKYRPQVLGGWTAGHMLALACTIYETGERIGALLSVPRHCFDAGGRRLFVPAELRKGRHEDRSYAVSAALAELLGSLPLTERLFDWRGKRQTLYNHWRRILIAAGIPTTRRHYFHCLRRTHATHLAIVAGIEAASRSLGHSSVELTRRSYIATSLLPQARPCDLLPTWA